MPPDVVSRTAWLAALMAAISFALSLAGALLLVKGYNPQVHPFALMGALPGGLSTVFNLAAFVVPGVLALLALALLRTPVIAGWFGRIGRHLGLIAAVGYLLMGVFTLDLEDLVGFGARAHATAWMVWLAAAVPSALLVGCGQCRLAGLRHAGWMSVAVAVLIALLCMLGIGGLDGPPAQLLAWVIWLLWIGMLARVGRRMARSSAIPDDKRL